MNVGELSAVVTLDNNRLPEVASQTAADFGKVEKSIDSVTRTARQADAALSQYRAGIELLTRGTVSYNQAAGVFVDATGKQINTTRLLNQVGIQTTGQIRAQIAALDDLTDAFNYDAAATAALAKQKQRLQDQLGGLNPSLAGTGKAAGAANLALLDVGRVVEDLPFGIRGVANNITPMIQSFQRLAKESKTTGQSITSALLGALKGGGGVIALFSLASTAALLFGDKLFSIKGKAESAADGIDTLKEAAEGLVSLSGRDFKIVGSQRDLSLGALGLSAEESRLKDEIRRANADIVSLTQAEFVELQKKQARLTTIQALQSGVLKAVGSEGRERRLAAEASKFGLQIEFQKETTTKNRKATLAEIRALQDRISGALRLQGELGERLNRTYGELFAKQLVFFNRLPTIFGGEGGLDKGKDALGRTQVSLPEGTQLRGPGLEELQRRIEAIKLELPELASQASIAAGAIKDQLTPAALIFVDSLGGGLADVLVGFKNLNDFAEGMRDTLKGLARDLVAAAIKAAALLAISRLIPGLGLTGGFGTFFSGFLGFGASQRFASAPATSGLSPAALTGVAYRAAAPPQRRLVAEIDMNQLRFYLSENEALANA